MALQGGGQPLSQPERGFFEPRFGADFSQVRIHVDSRADEMAHSLNAKAFTIGRDIVFASGQFSPGTISGKLLLAHELAHTIQQSGGLRGDNAQVGITTASRGSGNLLLQRKFDRGRLATYLAEGFNHQVIPERREYAITQLLDSKSYITSACQRFGVNNVSFTAAVLWQELYFRRADWSSGLQDRWAASPVLPWGENWSLGFGQVRPSTAAQVTGHIPFRPRSEAETTSREFAALSWETRTAYRWLLAFDISFNILSAVGYLSMLKQRRYPTTPWLNLQEEQLKMIASEYCHGPYPLSCTTPNFNGEQAMNIWWGLWFGTSCIRAEFPNI